MACRGGSLRRPECFQFSVCYRVLQTYSCTFSGVFLRSAGSPCSATWSEVDRSFRSGRPVPAAETPNLARPNCRHVYAAPISCPRDNRCSPVSP